MIEKRQLNLIILKDDELPILKSARKYLPIAGFISLAVFLCGYFYYYNNIVKISSVQEKIDSDYRMYEKRIENLRAKQQLTGTVISRLDQVIKLEKLPKQELTIDKIMSLEDYGVTVTGYTISDFEKISISMTASSSAALDNFVEAIHEKEKNKEFKEIFARSVVREKDGYYNFVLELKNGAAKTSG